MRTAKASLMRAFLGACGLAVAFAGFLIGSVIGSAFVPHGLGRMPRQFTPAFLAATLSIPVLACLLLGWALKRRGWFEALWPARTLTQRTVIVLIVAGYGLTAVLGEPAVQTSNTSWAVGEYKRLKVSDSPAVWKEYPYLATYAAFPVAPGLILTPPYSS